MITEKDLKIRCEYYFNKVGFTCTIPVHINNRLSKTWGRYIWRSNGNSVIEFSGKMLKTCTDNFIENVIAHECAHALVYLETLEHGHGHDSYFKDMCMRLGTTHTSPCNKGEFKEGINKDDVYKYVVWCDDCGAAWHYDRAGKVIKNLHECRCPHCKTNHLKYKQNW